MITKTLGTLLIVIACLILLPIAFGIVGAVFGIVFGVIGGVFGAVFGIFGGIFGAIAGFFSWMFDGIFGWHGPSFLANCNPFSLLLFAIIIALIIRSRQNRQQNKTP
jgi:hypothetical protein